VCAQHLGPFLPDGGLAEVSMPARRGVFASRFTAAAFRWAPEASSAAMEAKKW